MHPINILTGPEEVRAMALVAWSDTYTVKVRQFDDQHRKLMEMVNKLHDAMRAEKRLLIQVDVMTTLAGSLQTHFSDEERLMRHYMFPGVVPHKKAHDQMLTQVRNFQRKAESGENTITHGVMIFFKDWLVHHIRVEDAKYGPFMNGKGLA
jgi:hemerythrin